MRTSSMLKQRAICCALFLLQAVAWDDAAGCRDRWLEPFSSSSIWNTAIGSEAKFEPANLFHRAGYGEDAFPSSFHNDQDFLVRASASDPLTHDLDI